MSVEKLPPYCPELNPVEHLWEEIREKYFPNLLCNSMSVVEDTLVAASLHYETHVETVKSITGFDWIVNEILNAN